jgi:hypothetical protein
MSLLEELPARRGRRGDRIKTKELLHSQQLSVMMMGLGRQDLEAEGDCTLIIGSLLVI